MSYKLVWEPGGVLRQLLGNVTMHDRFASFEAICADERFDSIRYCLTDYRDVNGYLWDLESTSEIAAAHVGPLLTNPRLKFAAVTTRHDIIESVNAFIETGMTSAPYRIFPTLAEARRWLGS